jgi:hypothetical protein
MNRHRQPISRLLCFSLRWPAAIIALVLCAACQSTYNETVGTVKGPLGLDTVIAFYGGSTNLQSQTFFRGDDWKYWKHRGGIASRGVVHMKFLRKNVDDASDILANLDFGDNPNPVIDIDEFGWDYGGGIDSHTINILQAVRKKRPELKIAVHQMRARSRRSWRRCTAMRSRSSCWRRTMTSTTPG